MALIAFNGFAQYPVSGFVRDGATGEAVTGANVFLEGSYKLTFTDSKGYFSFSRIPKGEYSLRVTHISFNPYEKLLSVGDSVLFVEIPLEAKVYLSEEFIVSAVRSTDRLPGAVSSVSRQELRGVNMGQDIPFLLSGQPSLVITSDAGTGIGYTAMRMRGIDQNRINVTINGVPLNDAESHSVYWIDLPDFASSVEDIQIQRGVGTSTNGAGAFGGSMNIRTEQLNPKPYATTSISAGSFNTFRSSVGFGTGLTVSRFAFDGRMSKVLSDGYIDRSFSNLFSWYMSGGYYGKRTIFKAIVMSGQEITGLAWEGVPSEVLDTNRTWNPLGIYYDNNGKIKFYDNEVDNYLQNHYQLHMLHRINKNWNFNMALHLTTGKGYYESYKEDSELKKYDLPDVIYGNDTISVSDLVQRKWLDNRFYGATWLLARTSAASTLTFGGAANIYEGDHFGTLVWLEYPGEISKDYRWYESNGNKQDGNVFVKYIYQLTSKLLLIGDVQYRYINYQIDGFDDDLRDIGQQHSYNFFNPKAGLSYRYSDRNESWLFMGVANREPNRSNLTDARPDVPVPTEERLYNVELGHKINHKRFSLNSNAFVMYYSDQLVLTGEINDVGDPIMTNVDESYRVGVELVAGINITRWFKLEANAALSRNRIMNFTAYVDDWDTWIQREENLGETPIAFSPWLVAGSMMKFKPLDRLTVSFLSQYVSKQYLDNTGSEERALNAWVVHNIQIQYNVNVRWLQEMTARVILNNILGTRYESNGWIYRYYEDGVHKTSDGLFPQAGFHLLAGIQMRF